MTDGSRRGARCVGLSILCLLACVISGCSRAESAQTAEIVLYTSADDAVVADAIAAFEAESGLRVRLVGDTEATKTTGLVTRLMAERDQPRADVWWSSEPMGTIRLAEAGVLEDGGLDGLIPAGWPSQLVGEGNRWMGMAERARVIVYATDRVPEPPTTLAALADPAWFGRIGIARPEFGTTRAHMGMLLDRWGEEAFEAWLEAIESNKVRLYDGNARVVRAVAEGEIDVGLTDTDDVWAGQVNVWAIEAAFETPMEHERWPSLGPTTLPNTVAIVAGGPNPDGARTLAAFLVSESFEELLASTSSQNIPVHPGARSRFSGPMPDGIDERADFERASGRVSDALDMCARVLISP